MLLNRVVLPVTALLSLAFLVACGSTSNHATPPPGGSFSDKNLNGTYVFSVTGSDPAGYFQTIAGTFDADGNGNIKGGTLELNDAASGPVPATSVTGGGYTVGVDGRGGFRNGGGLTLQTSAEILTFDFVLSSSEHGLITEYDGNGTGSGTLDLQANVTQGNINGQSYAFNLSGIGSANTSTGSQTSFATVGAFTLDATGAVSTGLEDFNNNGSSLNLTDLPLSGSVSISAIPGAATLAAGPETLHFDVYPVDATHLKFIETDAFPIMSGDAFTQASSIPTGNDVFTLSGVDFTTNPNGPFTAAGLIVTDGSGNITNASVEDINDGGTGTASEVGSVTGGTAIGGSYTPLTGGRSVLTLTGFVNGNGGVGCTSCQFAIYPYSSGGGGLQILEIDGGGITGGVAYTQNSTSLASSSQGYAFNLAGANTNGEEDDIAEFVSSGTAFTGYIDFNDDITAQQAESLTPDKSFSATYSTDSTVPGRISITPNNSNAFNLEAYVVDDSTVAFVETDTGTNIQVGLGSFSTQNAAAMSNAAARHLTVMRLTAGAHKALKRR